MHLKNLSKNYAMNKIKYILLLPLFLMIGCLHRQNTFESYETQVLLSKHHTLSLKSGTVSPLDTINENILYHIHFNEVKGGDTSLFGKWTLTEGNGYNAKRLIIKKSASIVYSISISDLKKNNQSIVNLNKHLAD